MNIKTKISLIISSFFTLLFGLTSAFIIVMFSDFRKEEFKQMLEEKAMTTIRLLTEVKEIDKEILKVIDRNSINQLYNEKTLVFNSDYRLIYSSLDDTRINWAIDDLKFLQENHEFFKKDGENEIYGVFYDSPREDFFALISANDNYGKNKLAFLIYLVVGASVFFIILTWWLSFYLVKQQLIPLDFFHRNIRNINENNLETRLPVNTTRKNEIDLISIEFNYMMSRIEDAYKRQKEFTAQASHELRTPLARISAMIENHQKGVGYTEKLFFQHIFQNINQLNELIQSLLLLVRVEGKSKEHTEIAWIDEAIYNSIEKTHLQYPDFKVNFKIEETENMGDLLQVNCNQGLLEIAFANLLKNAYQYSGNKEVDIVISQQNQRIQVTLSNTGSPLLPNEQKRIFESYIRGKNATGKSGLGIGLCIVSRILSNYNFHISYRATASHNQFIIDF